MLHLCLCTNSYYCRNHYTIHWYEGFPRPWSLYSGNAATMKQWHDFVWFFFLICLTSLCRIMERRRTNNGRSKQPVATTGNRFFPVCAWFSWGWAKFPFCISLYHIDFWLSLVVECSWVQARLFFVYYNAFIHGKSVYHIWDLQLQNCMYFLHFVDNYIRSLAYDYFNLNYKFVWCS